MWRNDDARLSDQAAVAAQFDGVLLSPGPGTPERAGRRSVWCGPAPPRAPRCWACA
ncbi:putative anthranilate synthase component II [Mycobacterium xenopi 4042]|uniref:Putative anthranilate synthase component II n=1 Tax=Mycobacterium xenopi 4042 TaxID=1299334 RepID=X8CMI6_MYCXE|nr:putative anthranilate synthase component II [Mycobacterium xenopi 4042]